MEGIVRASTPDLESIEVGVATDQGSRPSQMDRYHVDKAKEFESRGYALFIIYDGHGDVRFAEHAEEHLARYILEDPEFSKGNYRQALNNAFLCEEQALWESLGQLKKGGTTVTVALLLREQQECYFANVGDSAAVLGSTAHSADPKSAVAVAMTPDDKTYDPSERDRLIQAHARFSQDGVVCSSHRINMTRALGDFDFKAQKTKTGTDWISPAPHIRRVVLDADEDAFIVLASDGLWNVFDEDSVVRAVQAAIQIGYGAQQIATDLVRATATSDIHPDNTTVIVVRLIWRGNQILE